MSTPLERLGRAAARALEEQEPPLDVAAGRRRLMTHVVEGQARPSSHRPLAVVALLAAAGAVLAVALGVWTQAPPDDYATGEAPRTIPFEGQTVLTLAPRSTLTVLARTPRGATVRVEAGRVEANVHHRAETAWRFKAGPYDVEVTGTQLSVEWSPEAERMVVAVTEGEVLVSGPRLEGRRPVRTGERLVLGGDEGPPAGEVPTPSWASPPPVSQTDEAPPAPPVSVRGPGKSPPSRRPAARPRPWKELELAGRFAEAVAAVDAAGLQRVLGEAGAEELLSISRAARLAGRPQLERDALVMCRARFPGTEHAAMAAFLLGREASPAQAATWFEAYLSEAPRGALSREAAGRRMEALHQAGLHEQAKDAASSYLERYPRGPHAPYARSLLEP